MWTHSPSFDSPASASQFDVLVRKAKAGNPEAQFELGGMYLQGQVGPPSKMLVGEPDYKQACKWFRRAAEQGHAEAQNSLGVRYNRGEGVREDHTEACKWFRRAEAHGSTQAASVNLAMNLLRGLGEPQSISEALTRFRKAAYLSDPLAQYHLAALYQQGHGVTKDTKTAKSWFRRAAEQRYVPAQSMLGYLCATELEDEDEVIEAYLWSSLAASHGDADASS